VARTYGSVRGITPQIITAAQPTRFIMVTPSSFTEYPILAAQGAGNIQVKEVLSWAVSVDSEDYAAAI
jgi:uncharacterized membrane protein YkgB